MTYHCLELFLAALLASVPVVSAAQERSPDSVPAAPAPPSPLVTLRIGDLQASVPRDSLVAWIADSIPLGIVLSNLEPSAVRCPMRVWVPWPGTTVPMPTAKPDSTATVPMPTDSTVCINPRGRRPRR